ncbi:MAG: hypothetical protein ACREBC_24755, partial [Pyrinomonadaceae bacterium]
MRVTVKTKIIAGLAVITLIGIFTMLLIYRGLKEVENDVHELAQVQEPLILAAYEMEINMNGIGLEVLKYLNTRNPRYRQLATEDISDFNEFHAAYRKLIASDEERALDATISKHFSEFVALANSLMQRADEQEGFFKRVSDGIEQIDEFIHGLQPGIVPNKGTIQSSFNKAIAAVRMEAEIAELGFWSANYQRLQNPAFKREINEKITLFVKALADFQQHDLTARESETARAVNGIFEQLKIGIDRVVEIEDSMAEQRERFIELRVSMDEMLDDQIQPLARQHLD